VLAFSEASDETVVLLVEVFFDEAPLVLLVALAEPLDALEGVGVDALEAPAEVLEEPVVGWNVWCPGPKPTSGAKVPPIVTVSLSSLPVMISLPLPLSDAVT